MISHNYTVISHTGGEDVADNKRTEYFRQRRQSMKQSVFLIDKEKASLLDEKLKEQGLGRTEWFRAKVDEELRK